MNREVSWSSIIGLLVIAWAIAIHLSFLAAVRDPIFQPDSGSYALPALNLLFGRPFDLSLHRTPGYPLFLYAALAATHRFAGVLILQHLLALLTGAGAAWLYYRFIWKSQPGAAIVFFVSSAFPLSPIYAHMILTETLYTFLLIGAVLLFLFMGERPSKALGVAAGVIVALVILTRPVGRPLLAVFVLAAALKWREQRRGSAWLYGGLGALTILLTVSLWRYSTQGFFGIDQMGGPSFFCCTARYLDPNKLQDSSIRDILKPFYERQAAKMEDGDWIYSAADGPVKTLARHIPPDRLNRIFGDLAFQAIQNQPFRFLWDRLSIAKDFFVGYSEISPVYLSREYTFFVYRGLHLYEPMADLHPRAWSLLHYGRAERDAYFARLRPLAKGEVAHPEQYLAEMDKQDVYRYENVLLWWKPLTVFMHPMRWLPFLTLMSTLVLWRSRKIRYPITVLGLVIVAQALTCTMAGFQDPRFAFPLTPLYAALAIGGLQACFASLAQRIRAKDGR